MWGAFHGQLMKSELEFPYFKPLTKKSSCFGWSLLWTCYVFCYFLVLIVVKNVLSARMSGQMSNPYLVEVHRNMHNKIALIILTDFLCWIPFIIVSIIHNIGSADVTRWYVNFAMAVLPYNSFISPLIYETTVDKNLLSEFLKFWLGRLNIYGYNWVCRNANMKRIHRKKNRKW